MLTVKKTIAFGFFLVFKSLDQWHQVFKKKEQKILSNYRTSLEKNIYLCVVFGYEI